MIPKETIDILKGQVFGFDTFFVTSQEPYEVIDYTAIFTARLYVIQKSIIYMGLMIQGGVLFKGNLRGSAAVSYEKIEKRLHVSLTLPTNHPSLILFTMKKG